MPRLKKKLKKYYNNIQKELKSPPASNIWNYNKTNLQDDSGSKKIVMKRSMKYPERGNSGLHTQFIRQPIYRSHGLKMVQKFPASTEQKSGWFDKVTFEE